MGRTVELNVQVPAVQALCQCDPRLGQLITIVGELTLETKDDPFQSLVSSIIGQQLSVKAAGTIYKRVLMLCSELTPVRILSIPYEDLRSAGVSIAKISYLKDLSEKVMMQELDLSNLCHYENEEVIKSLTNIKGIGQWTAEMFLIFTLCRMNVLSLGDVGLQRAAKWLYGMDKKEDGKKLLIQKSSGWTPHYTIASLYLWESVNLGFVDTFSSIDEVKAKS